MNVSVTYIGHWQTATGRRVHEVRSGGPYVNQTWCGLLLVEGVDRRVHVPVDCKQCIAVKKIGFPERSEG